MKKSNSDTANLFKMNRNAFSMGAMNEETEKHDYSHLSKSEQNQVAVHLISIAYGFVGKPWPKMDRSKFEIIKREF